MNYRDCPIFFLQVLVVFLHMCTNQYSAEDSRETFCSRLERASCAALSFPVSLSANFSCLGLQNSQPSFPNWALFAFPLLTLWALNSSMYECQGGHRARLVGFPSCRDQCPMLPVVQYLNTVFWYNCLYL